MPGFSTYLAEQQLLQAYIGDDGTNLTRMKAFLNQSYSWLQMQSDWSWLRLSSVLSLESNYAVGTVTLTADSTALTLSGGTWNTAWVSRRIYVEGEVYEIASFSNTTTAVLARASRVNAAGVPYVMFRSNYAMASRMRSVSVLSPTALPYDPLTIVTVESLNFLEQQNPIFRDPPEQVALVDVDSDIVPTVNVWPWPGADARGIRYSGMRLLAALSGDADTLLIPSSLHDVFRNKALSRLWHWRNDARWKEAEAKANNDLQKAIDMDPADADRGDRVNLERDVFLGPNDRNWPPRAGIG